MENSRVEYSSVTKCGEREFCDANITRNAHNPHGCQLPLS